MNKLVIQFRDILIGLFILSGILALFQIEIVIPTLLFALLTYGGITMIKSAITHDLKHNKLDKT